MCEGDAQTPLINAFFAFLVFSRFSRFSPFSIFEIFLLKGGVANSARERGGVGFLVEMGSIEMISGVEVNSAHFRS